MADEEMEVTSHPVKLEKTDTNVVSEPNVEEPESGEVNDEKELTDEKEDTDTQEQEEPICEMDGIAVSLSTDEQTLLSDTLQESNPEDVPVKTQFEQLLELCNGNYTICENHTAEMLEKNIVCKNCLQPMCALCLHQYHAGHSMISLVKLREIKKIKETLDKDIVSLKEKTTFYKEEGEIRADKIIKIETEAKNILYDLTTGFDQLMSVIEAKKKELCFHITSFKNEQLEIIRKEMEEITKQEKSINELNEKVEAFYRTIDLKDAEKLPELSSEILSNEVSYLHTTTDSWRPDKKYAKLLPSIQAVANVCQSIHPEATKVIWWKVDGKKNKEKPEGTEEKPAKKRRIEHDSPKMPTDGGKQTSPNIFEKMTSTPQTSSFSKPSSETPDSTWQDSTPVSKETPAKPVDSSDTINFDCLDFDVNELSPGRKILVNGHMGQLWIGEVADTKKLKTEKLFGVKWCTGRVGQQRQFGINEKWTLKSDTAHSSCIVCHFDHDLSEPLSEEFEKVLLHAGKEKERLDKIEKSQSRKSHQRKRSCKRY